MISGKYLREIGLNDEQITLLTDVLKKESRFRWLLESEKVTHIEAIMESIDPKEIDLSNEELLREKIRVEYAAFIFDKSIKSNVMKNSIKSVAF